MPHNIEEWITIKGFKKQICQRYEWNHKFQNLEGDNSINKTSEKLNRFVRIIIASSSSFVTWKIWVATFDWLTWRILCVYSTRSLSSMIEWLQNSNTHLHRKYFTWFSIIDAACLFICFKSTVQSLVIFFCGCVTLIEINEGSR